MEIQTKNIPILLYNQYFQDIVEFSDEIEFNSTIYNNIFQNICTNLITISLTLKNLNQEQRTSKVQDYIKQSNQYIEQYLNQNYNVQENQNPIQYPAFNNDSQNEYIVKIHDTVQFFETRKRVPYKIVIETISTEDHYQYQINKEQQQAKKQQTHIEQQDIDNLIKLENKMQLNRNLSYNGSASKSSDTQDSNNFSNQNFCFNGRIRKQSDSCSQQNVFELNNTQILKRKKESYIFNSESSNKNTENLLKFEKNFSLKQEQKIKQNINNNQNQQINELQSKSDSSDIDIDYPEWSQEKLNNYKKNFKKFISDLKNNNNNKQKRKGSLDFIYENIYQERLKSNKQDFQNLQIVNKKKSVKKTVTLKSKISFLSKLGQNLNEDKQSKLIKMFQKLHYDYLDKNLDNNEEIQEFPRKFGPWGELWEDSYEVIKKESKYKDFKSHQIRQIIVKGNDDVRQEIVCMKVIQQIFNIFKEGQKKIWLQPYQITALTTDSGIIEFLPNTLSIDSIKKKLPGISLQDLFEESFQTEEKLQQAKQNFASSLAGYSIVCYLLQIKDRHNGNILIDKEGHIIHIDFGFILGISPGGIGFEKAPFKLIGEYADVLGGKKSQMYKDFCQTFCDGFKFLNQQKYIDQIVKILEESKEQYPDIPCFTQQKYSVDSVIQRFQDKPEQLLKDSLDNWKTKGYDIFQYTQNKIAR